MYLQELVQGYTWQIFLCLRVKFHKSLFWVPILAAGGPYWPYWPSTLTELKVVVEAFAESVDPEEVKRSARSTWKRAKACRAVAGASFEGSHQKILKGLDH